MAKISGHFFCGKIFFEEFPSPPPTKIWLLWQFTFLLGYDNIYMYSLHNTSAVTPYYIYVSGKKSSIKIQEWRKFLPYNKLLMTCVVLNILKISFQYNTYMHTGKETPFRLEIDKATSSKTNTLFLCKKRNQKAANFHICYLHMCCLDQFLSGCSRINWIVFCYSERFIANVIPCFLWDVQFSFGLRHVCMYLLILRSECYSFLRRCCLIWKRKQHISVF